eukprot:TRINITY_DN4987_c0_g1_i1.p1 TRINITY_DN4987_c0_g1~~TRINITY_DN4987_c0_g1_i1.p1  ORF type:complete len:231 (+),score=49.08 TRINITY_DN4987_c0_g1_i1:49-693(+)
MSKLKGGLALSVLSIALIALSYSFWWYQIEVPTSSSALHPVYKIQFSWVSYTTTDKDGQTSITSYDKADTTNVKTTFTTSLTLLTIGGGFAIGHLVMQIIGLAFKKMPSHMLWKVVAGLMGIAATVLVAVSVLLFLQLPQAFQKDEWCKQILLGYFDADGLYNCAEFVGSKNLEDILGRAWQFNYFPGAGWGLGVGAVLFCMLSVFMTLLAKRR